MFEVNVTQSGCSVDLGWEVARSSVKGYGPEVKGQLQRDNDTVRHKGLGADRLTNS